MAKGSQVPTKMRIESYKDSTFSSQVSTYTVRVNPEKYSRTYKVDYKEEGAVGSANATLKFNRMPPSRVQFELLFDATGTIPNSAEDLTTELESFLSTVYDYQGAIHEPYYLKLFWGTMAFAARLTDLRIQYTLFSPEGDPLRARADATFADYIDPKTLAKKEDKQSPDLTHVLTVKEGDTLPLLCHRVYGDSTFYPQVARANGLTHFRRLKAGTRLVFPPLK